MHMKSQVRVLLGLLTEPNWVKYDQLLFFFRPSFTQAELVLTMTGSVESLRSKPGLK
jgi:hypothetical protein